MSVATALGLSGALLIFVALVVAFVADNEAWKRKSARLSVIAWIAFAVGVLSLIAAIWVEVLA